MGSFVFIWPNAGEEVFVTGTFDNWSKSEKLEKVGDVFQKSVELKDASKKIYYKFVVDGNWVLDPAAPREKDDEGNDNNVLTPENIIVAAPATAVISSVAPESTTAELASAVPVEEKKDLPLDETPVTILPVTEEPPAAAVESPASAAIINSVAPTSTTAQLAGAVPLEAKKQAVVEDAPVSILPVTEEPSAAAEETPASAAVISSVAPSSTTAGLAGAIPLEEKKEATVEVAAPEETKEESSTAADVAAPVAAAAAGVAAIGAAVVATTKSTAEDAKNMSDKVTADVPGAFPGTPASELNKEVKLINPLPAAPGGVNPVTLAPGEKIPDELKAGDINANVKLDPESYEKADAAIAGDFSAEQLPPVSRNMIPESSLPIVGSNDVAINSVAPAATTAALAGAVPLEKKAAAAEATVPEVVKESQEAAGVSPEASAVPEEVAEKEQVEAELLKKVPEAPATSEGAAGESSASTAGIVGGVTAAANEPVSTDVPAEVKESIQEAAVSPEAAANPVAVQEKMAVEAELVKKVGQSAAAPAEAAAPAAEVNGKEAAPAAVAAPAAAIASASSTPAAKAGVPASAEKKKKSRFSGFFHKIMDKIDGDKKK